MLSMSHTLDRRLVRIEWRAAVPANEGEKKKKNCREKELDCKLT